MCGQCQASVGWGESTTAQATVNVGAICSPAAVTPSAQRLQTSQPAHTLSNGDFPMRLFIFLLPWLEPFTLIELGIRPARSPRWDMCC